MPLPRMGMPRMPKASLVAEPRTCYHGAMAETANAQTASTAPKGSPKLAPVSTTVLHRVCIQCNNMFRVTPDKFDAKQCPACHKS